jgi:hypothetical protein
MYNISRQAILKEIAKLIKENIIVLKGEGRGAHYQLKFKKAIG